MATRKQAVDPVAAQIAAVAAKQGKAAKKDSATAPKRTPKEKPGIVLPKTVAAVTDLLYKTQQERYAIQAQAKVKEEIEAACRDFLIQELPKGEASGVSGKVARSYVENKDVYQVQDWAALQAYVYANAKTRPGIWGIFQKRVSAEMVTELMEDPKEAKKLGKALKKVPVPVVRLNKL